MTDKGGIRTSLYFFEVLLVLTIVYLTPGALNAQAQSCDPPCAPDEFCFVDMCVGIPTMCSIDSDCPEDEICERGFCTPPRPGGCSSDGDCMVGEMCDEGFCVPTRPGGCNSDEDCMVGEICLGGACFSEPGLGFCGDGVVGEVEQCDEGILNGSQSCCSLGL